MDCLYRQPAEDTAARHALAPGAGGMGASARSPGPSLEQQRFNKAHNGLRAIGERGNSLLKMTFQALRNVSLDPWRIGAIVAVALVLLHYDHARTT